jgi:S-adenosylmethionine decarboxylase
MGKHVIMEVYDVEFNLLNDLYPLVKIVKQSIRSINMTILNTYTHKFHPQGLTVLICLAESHVSLHTFPEHNCITFDAYTCGDNNPKHIAMDLLKYLDSSNYQIREFAR